ncbi:acetate--CoA ligase family protein [Desulforhabdus sp. TSK]|uniref:acetate--CoA ligase family protein n=1 Tax=Desulforhabdus sp. TSK TaxID=2925014 RepID=UPI001FC81723|nr:acetate--CoA ligase family protein [Desulforhabdus sp. TSK]GKT06998.1 acetyl-CoA synthetase [Desulforhabdus sp. TSK]
MLTDAMHAIIESSRDMGWIMEPEAKRLMSLYGIEIPPYAWVRSHTEVKTAAEQLGFPLAAKVVSPKVVHKSDVGGVAVGIDSVEALTEVFERFCKIDGFLGMHVEAMARGVELIIGSVVDAQFGPVVLLGIGGTSVEIYKDTAVRMAPITEKEVADMVDSLKGRALIQGYRGGTVVSMERLSRLLVSFSHMVMDLEGQIASIDLNPVIASENACVIADARIMLAADGKA